jgi:hypothetical protein
MFGPSLFLPPQLDYDGDGPARNIVDSEIHTQT